MISIYKKISSNILENLRFVQLPDPDIRTANRFNNWVKLIGAGASLSISSISLSVARRPTESKAIRRSFLPMIPSLSWSISWKACGSSQSKLCMFAGNYLITLRPGFKDWHKRYIYLVSFKLKTPNFLVIDLWKRKRRIRRFVSFLTFLFVWTYLFKLSNLFLSEHRKDTGTATLSPAATTTACPCGSRFLRSTSRGWWFFFSRCWLGFWRRRRRSCLFLLFGLLLLFLIRLKCMIFLSN